MRCTLYGLSVHHRAPRGERYPQIERYGSRPRVLGGFANPSGGDRPQVAYSAGCQVPPLPSTYLANGNAGYNRYDVNISTGECTAGAVMIFNEAITGAAGVTITQPVTVPGLGTGTATFVLPPAAATPTPARAAAPQHGITLATYREWSDDPNLGDLRPVSARYADD